MKLIQQIFFALLCGGYFFIFIPFHTSAFLGEDLGIELYDAIDKGLAELEQKQTEYEMTGQGETSIWEFARANGLNCDISSIEDVNKLAGVGVENHIAFVLERCADPEEWRTPALLAEHIMNQATHFNTTFSTRAADKTRRTYDIARIGLYSDGNIENSPFDLINDLQEIDYIIFWEELEYNGEPYAWNADDILDDFLNEDKDYLYEDEDEEDDETWSGTIDDEEDIIWDHEYICPIDDDSSGLDDDIEDEIIEEIEGGTGTGGYTPRPRYWTYPGGEVWNGSSWGWPFPAMWPTDPYTPIKDSWKCSPSDFFCIIIEFQSSSYGLAGGETRSIKKVLSKVAEHLEKPANASLTQHKMTTNNFELGSIIKNLPDMLRGFWIEVQSKPIPILDDIEGEEKDEIEWDVYEIENLLRAYYKNNGMDYDRRNDLNIFNRQEEQTKVLQTSRWMPILYPEARVNELSRFQAALAENNRVIEQSIDKKILQDDMKDFAKQFTELEKFVAAMKDFAESISGVVWEMKRIPTRSS